MELKEVDIRKIVKDELRKFSEESLDKEIGRLMGSKNTATRSEQIKTIKDALESVYKVLWQKRDFWKSDIR